MIARIFRGATPASSSRTCDRRGRRSCQCRPTLERGVSKRSIADVLRVRQRFPAEDQPGPSNQIAATVIIRLGLPQDLRDGGRRRRTRTSCTDSNPRRADSIQPQYCRGSPPADGRPAVRSSKSRAFFKGDHRLRALERSDTCFAPGCPGRARRSATAGTGAWTGSCGAGGRSGTCWSCSRVTRNVPSASRSRGRLSAQPKTSRAPQIFTGKGEYTVELVFHQPFANVGIAGLPSQRRDRRCRNRRRSQEPRAFEAGLR